MSNRATHPSPAHPFPARSRRTRLFRTLLSVAVLALLAAPAVPAAAQSSAQPIDFDLRQWTKQGPDSVGTWEVADDGSEVIQTRNDAPTYFVSPESISNATISGTFEVQTGSDDDYIGFVFGYDGPTRSDPFRYDHLLFDWKQSSQGGFGGCTAQEGFALTHIQGRLSEDPDERMPGNGFVRPVNWCHEQADDDPRAEVLATDWGEDRGWEDNTEYAFELTYSPDRVTIAIDGEQIFDVAGNFEPGSFGFYNYSQASVRYSGFTATAEEPTDQLPTRLQDLWVVDALRTVDDDGQTVELTDRVLDGLDAQGGDPVRLADGVTFTPKPDLATTIAEPDRTPRGDVHAVGGILETPEGRALTFLGTPDRGTGIAVDDRLLFDLTFLGDDVLAPGDPLLVDHSFTQVLPAGGTADDDLPPLDLLASRMAAGSGQYLAVRGGDGALEPAIITGQVWETYEGSTGIDGPAKSGPMLDGFESGAQSALEEGGGTGGVKEFFKDFFDGADDSRCMAFNQVTTGGGGGEDCGDPPPSLPPGTPGGSSTGEPHLRTFDGLAYDLQAAGEFTAAVTEDLELQLRYEPYRNRRDVSVTTAAALQAAGHRVTVTAGSPATVRLDGTELSPRQLGNGLLVDGLRIQDWLGQLHVTTPEGHQMKVSPRSSLLNVYLDQGTDVEWAGLFGDGNGDPDDDYTTRDGRDVGPDPTFEELYDDFAESWRITQDTSLFDYEAGNSTDTYTDRSFPDEPVSADSLPEADRTRAEAVCTEAGIVDQPQLDDCILDYALSGEMSLVEASQGADRVSLFRDGRLDFARPGCPSGLVPERGFFDVSSGSVHEPWIDCLAWWDITTGRADGTYDPTAAVNRDQMASFLARLLTASGVALPQDPPDAFDDDDGTFHEANINRLAAMDIVSGTGERTYEPNSAVTRGQLASLLVRTLGVIGIDLPAGEDRFSDDTDIVHEPNINKAANAGLVRGTTRTTYEPSLRVRRDQSASLMSKALGLLVDRGLASRPTS